VHQLSDLISLNNICYHQLLNALQEYKSGTHTPIDFQAETYKKAYDALKTKWSQLTQDRPCHALAIRNWLTDYCLFALISPFADTVLTLYGRNKCGAIADDDDKDATVGDHDLFDVCSGSGSEDNPE